MSVQLTTLVQLAWHSILFSLFAVGGGVSILIPQMHHEYVQVNHWVDDRTFAELLAISQASPGPNFLLIPLIGWRVAALPGVVVAMMFFLICPVTISFFVGRWLHRRENEWIRRLRRAFRPVTAGLWIAAGIVIAIATDHAVVPVAITATVFVISLVVDIGPIWWCLIAGVAGAAFAHG